MPVDFIAAEDVEAQEPSGIQFEALKDTSPLPYSKTSKPYEGMQMESPLEDFLMGSAADFTRAVGTAVEPIKRLFKAPIELPWQIAQATGLVSPQAPNPLTTPMLDTAKVARGIEETVPEEWAGPVRQIIGAPAQEGVKQFAAENIAGLSTPENVALMATPMAGALAKVPAAAAAVPVGRYFQGQIIAGLPEQAQAFAQATEPTEKVRTGLNFAAGLTIPAAIQHGISPRTPLLKRAAAAAMQERGVPDALESKTAQPFRPVREQPIEGPGQVPAEGAGPEAGQRGSEKAAAPEAEQQGVLLTPEEDALVQAEREAIDKDIVTVDELHDQENSPFARGRIATVRPDGTIEIHKANFQEWIQNIPENQRAESVKSLIAEESNHAIMRERTTPEERGQFWEDMSAPEKAIFMRIYTGEWTLDAATRRHGFQLDPEQLGYEAMNHFQMRLGKMTPREVAEAALREKWTVKTLGNLSNAILKMREGLGTEASGRQRALIDRVTSNLEIAKKAVAGQAPSALNKNAPEPQPEHFTPEEEKLVSRGNPKPSLGAEYFRAAGEKVSDPDFWVGVIHRHLKGDLYGQEMAYQAGAFLRELGDEGAAPVIKAMEEARTKLYDESRALMKEGKMDRAMGIATMVQFPREAIESARDMGSGKGIIPESRGKPLTEPQMEAAPSALNKFERTVEKKSEGPPIEILAVLSNREKQMQRVGLIEEVMRTLPELDDFISEVPQYNLGDPKYQLRFEQLARKALDKLKEQRAKAQALGWKEGIGEIDRRIDAFDQEITGLKEQSFPSALNKRRKGDKTRELDFTPIIPQEVARGTTEQPEAVQQVPEAPSPQGPGVLPPVPPGEPAPLPFGKGVRQAKLAMPGVPGAVERGGFQAPLAKDIDKAAADRAGSAIAAGTIPDFEAYHGELQSRYGGGLTREKAFFPWTDAVQKNLLNAPGSAIRSLLGKLGLVDDVAQALKPQERDPSLGAIPDAPAEIATQRSLAGIEKAFEPNKWRTPSKTRAHLKPEQQRRLAAIGAIYDKLAEKAGGRPKRQTFRTTVGPEDVASRFVVLEPSEPVPGAEGEFTQPQVETSRQLRGFTPEQAADPKIVADAALANAREHGAKVSATKGLLAVRDKLNRVLLVSAWRDGRRGPVITNPVDPSGQAIKIDAKMLGRFEPTHALTLREPVEGFRQTFDSPEAFSRWFGDVGVEGTPGLRTSSFTGPEAGTAREQAGITGGVSRVTPPEEPLRALAGPEAPSKTARELTMPRFARRAVLEAPLPPGMVSEGRPAPLPKGGPRQVTPPEMLSPEAQAKIAEGAEERFPSTPIVPEISYGKPTGTITEKGKPAPAQPGAPLRAGLTGEHYPAALNKMRQAAKDQLKITVDDLKAIAARHDVKKDVPRLLDGAEASARQFASTAKARIILDSGDKAPPGLTGKALRRANKAMAREAADRRRAGIAYVASGRKDIKGNLTRDKTTLATRSTDLDIGEAKAAMWLGDKSKMKPVLAALDKQKRKALAWVSGGNPYLEAKGKDLLASTLEAKKALTKFWGENLNAGLNPLKRREGRKWMTALKGMREELAYAQKHWDDPAFRAGAEGYESEIHDTIQYENANGFDVQERDNYIPGLYEGAFWSDNGISFGSRRLLGSQYRMPKKFQNPYEAIAAGPYYLASRDLADLAEHRIAAGHRKVERSLWMNSLTGIDDPTSKQPIAKEPIYSKKTRTDPLTGNTWDQVTWRSPSPEYELVDSYTGGKPMAIRRGYKRVVQSSIRPDFIDEAIPFGREALAVTQALKHGVILLWDTFHPGRLGQYMIAQTGRKAGYRGGYSALSYRAQDLPRAVEQGYISKASADWATGEVDVKLPSGRSVKMTRKAIADQLIAEGLNASKISDAMYKHAVQHIPIIGERYHKIIAPYNKWLFDRFVPGMMVEAAVRNFEKINDSHPQAGLRAISRDVVRDTNLFFGNMGRQGVFRSATFRSLAQLTLLAPLWQEGLLRKELTFATRLAMLPVRGAFALAGKEAPFRKGLPALGSAGAAMASGLASYFVLSQLINLTFRRQLTFQNKEEGHKLDAWIPTGKDTGFWLSPMAVFAEVTHDLIRLGETKPKVWDRIIQMGENRLGPIGKLADILITGKSPTGERFTTSGAQLRAAAGQVIPGAGAVPITFSTPGRALGHKLFPNQVAPNQPGAVTRQLLASGAGIKVQTGRTQLAQASNLARDFMEREKLTKDTGWMQMMTDDPSYTRLRTQIRNGDNGGALKTLNGLRRNRTDADIIKGMKIWAKRPLTGSKENERKFIYSMSDKELDTYTKANEERMQLLDEFYDWLNRQP